MNLLPRNTLIFFVIALILLLMSQPTEAKKRCKPLLKKLHNVQSMQRQSYSLKRGQSLRNKEDKARARWWDCENLSKSRFNKKYGVKKSNSKKAATKKKRKSSSSRKVSRKKSALITQANTIQFNQRSAVVIKAKYQGVKLSAWQHFYQKPVKCRQPKSLSIFSQCHEDKRQQQTAFEKQYQSNDDQKNSDVWKNIAISVN